MERVLISEVGPRDGLQSVKATMPTAHKRAWIAALHGAGLRELGYDDAAIAGLSKAHIIGGHPA